MWKMDEEELDVVTKLRRELKDVDGNTLYASTQQTIVLKFIAKVLIEILAVLINGRSK